MNVTYKEKFAIELKNPYKWKESKKKRKKGVTLFNIKKKRETKCKNIMLCKNKMYISSIQNNSTEY